MKWPAMFSSVNMKFKKIGLASAASFLPFASLTYGAHAQEAGNLVETVLMHESLIVVIGTALACGACVFSLVSANHFAKGRKALMEERDVLAKALGEQREQVARSKAIFENDNQRLLIWQPGEESASLMGRPDVHAGEPDQMPLAKADFLAFGKWLTHESSHEIDRAINLLRESGEAFTLSLQTLSGPFLEASGRTASGIAYVRFRSLTRERQALIDLQQQHNQTSSDLAGFQGLLEALPQPVWLRRADGSLAWANEAYTSAAGRNDDGSLSELLDQEANTRIASTFQGKKNFSERLHAIIEGKRRTYDVVAVPSNSGSSGIATDVTHEKDAQAALKRSLESHEKTLNALTTAVAIFNADSTLIFYNNAYQSQFGLSSAFLASKPKEAEILDKLRGERKIPEQADFRKWKAEQLEAYRSSEAVDVSWYLPDGTTLRVVTTPHPQGGVTRAYENLTEQLDLESQVNVLSRIQGETLDQLSDGVAVFESGGNLALCNGAFGKLWRLERDYLDGNPHVNEVISTCQKLHDNQDDWTLLRSAIVGVIEDRAGTRGQMMRNDGSVLDFASLPLVDGRTMVTFVDVTDSVNVQRALKEKNEALQLADRLKSDFLQHVSYELRSPLTNVIGFAQLMSDADIGPLNDKQTEYMGYIQSSSEAVLAIIDNILDLTTADAGIIELDRQSILIGDCVTQAIEGLQDRIQERDISFVIDIPEGSDALVGDQRRLTQVLFNLLSNAIRYSDPGGRVKIAVERAEDSLALQVTDWGAGIPDDFIDHVFNRFETRKAGDNRGGAGLGLSIVKRFVQLHGGDVSIQSEVGMGTTVTCSLPLEPTPMRSIPLPVEEDVKDQRDVS